MSLRVGARLGHYEVTAKIGEGGMGEVWQATDTKLNRQVALEILPEAFAADPDRLALVHLVEVDESEFFTQLANPPLATKQDSSLQEVGELRQHRFRHEVDRQLRRP